MVEPVRAPTQGADLRVVVLRSRFNDAITRKLLGGAMEALRQSGVPDPAVSVFEVPGAIELPLAAELAIASARRAGGVDAVVALGAVIQGETRHFDYVCKMAAEGLQRVSLDHKVPIAFGVLTCETLEQALARAGAGSANRGYDAAMAALEMANLARHLAS